MNNSFLYADAFINNSYLNTIAARSGLDKYIPSWLRSFYGILYNMHKHENEFAFVSVQADIVTEIYNICK